MTGPLRVDYGPDPAQYAELWTPAQDSRGVVVVIHGGFWKAAYDAALGRPLAASLAARGWTAWNLEYRRVGCGGGVPHTLDDVSAGIDALADADLGLDLGRASVVALGHSAGGHLAAWAAARHRFARWAEARVRPTAVVSQAGVLDLGSAHRDGLGGGAVAAFVGEPPGPAYDAVDPIRQLPLDVPLWCVHAPDDADVPITQSRDYVQAARSAGARADLLEVQGGHFAVVDPASVAWAAILDLLDSPDLQGVG